MDFLAVDDSPTIRRILNLTLTTMGHKVVEAENGKVAIETLQSGNFGCVILDMNMPEMNGMEFLAARKKNPDLNRIPVIVLTTHEEDSLKHEAMSYGVSGFVNKPFESESFKATIKAIAG